MTVAFQIPELVTERLRLRLPRASDLAAHTAFRTSERSKSVGGPFDAGESFGHLAGIIGQWQLRGFGRWMVADRDTDEPLGIVGILHPVEWPGPELAWTVYENAEGRGIAYEAAVAARRFAYQKLGIERLISLVEGSNTRSESLARRLGCSQDGTFSYQDNLDIPVWLHPTTEAD